MSELVNCPELSTDPSVTGVIATWFSKTGETVKEGQILAEIAVDKVVLDIPSPAAGVITLEVAEEAEVTAGQLIARID